MENIRRREFLIRVGKTLPVIAIASVIPGCSTKEAVKEDFEMLPHPINVNEFISLSSILTGVSESMLSETLAKEYISRLQNTKSSYWNKDDLNNLLVKYSAIVKSGGNITQKVNEQILGNPQCGDSELNTDYPYRYLAREIIFIWYTSAIYDENDNYVFGSAEGYVESLAWKVAEGHPQAQCGGPLGYWQKPAGKITSWTPPAVCSKSIVPGMPCKQKSQPPGEPLLGPYKSMM